MCPLIGPIGKRYLRDTKNVTLKTGVKWNLKDISVGYNNLAYFDVEFVGKYPGLDILSAPGNNMEYLNPKSLASVYAL